MNGLDENDAFSFIQKRALSDRVTIWVVANIILTGVLHPGDLGSGATDAATVHLGDPAQEGPDTGSVYLDTDDPTVAAEFEAALVALLAEFGLDLSPAGEVEWGSWWRRFALKGVGGTADRPVVFRIPDRACGHPTMNQSPSW